MQLRLLKLCLAGVAAVTFAAVRPAHAGDDGDKGSDHPSDTSDDGGDTGDKTANTDHADPATKTLPSHASAKAQANAFGQEGARQKAAHQAAKSAAVKEAQRAAQATLPTLPAQAVAGRAHAEGNGRPASPGSSGLDIAQSHGAHGSPTSHPGGR